MADDLTRAREMVLAIAFCARTHHDAHTIEPWTAKLSELLAAVRAEGRAEALREAADHLRSLSILRQMWSGTGLARIAHSFDERALAEKGGAK